MTLLAEAALVLGMILGNGLLAMSEMAIVSSRKARLEALAQSGSRGARRALAFLDDPSRLLSAVQIGITLTGVVSGAYSGATLGARLGHWLDSFPALASHGLTLGMGATVVGITFLSLIFGELTPKRLAFAHPERIAAAVARSMHLLTVAAAPAVWLLGAATALVLRLLGAPRERDSAVTEEEVKSLIAEGTATGVFDPQERQLLEAVLRLADRPARVIMTPRARIAWVDARADATAVHAALESARHSRLLVCDGDIDQPVGMLHAKTFAPAAWRDPTLDLAQVMTPVLFVPENAQVLDLLDRFRKEKVHLAVIIDEYGAVEGVVTVTDILESIAGGLPEHGEEEAPGIAPFRAGAWLVDGALPMDEVIAALASRPVNASQAGQAGQAGLAVLASQEGQAARTMAGFMLHHLERIPAAGDGFELEGVRYEVVDMDGRRVDKVLITLPPEPAGPDNAKTAPPKEAA